ncbi:uncharacterized protein [Procambarus clarkii]|uniref:uncharacterized protein n=1 Tax=Procambarus clarkii TaxID=6728 RepID=UPI003743C9C7
MGQDVNELPCINIDDNVLESVHEFVYLGSTISDTLSLDTELNRHIGKAATTLARPTKRIWKIVKLTVHTKAQVYIPCMVSRLLYGSESCTLRSRQETRLNTFHMWNLRRNFDITCKNDVTNNTVLERIGVTSMFTLLKQRGMQWLGHVTRMEDGHIPKDLLYGELASGKKPTGRPDLRFKDACKLDLKHINIDTKTWGAAPVDRSVRRCKMQKGLQQLEDELKRQT